MQQCPLFSVIIPVYNSENFLKKCVESVLAQTFSNFEIVVVDDGSIDNSAKICDELKEKDERVKVIHKENGGVSVARKVGAEAASGEYVAFIDSDDWVEKNYLEVFAEEISKTDADIICSGIYYDNKNGFKPYYIKNREGYYSKQQIEKEIIPSLIAEENADYFLPTLNGKMVKKQLFLEYAISNSLINIGEDGACTIACILNAESMVILKQCFHHYLYNPSSATKALKAFNWDWPIIAYNHIVDNCGANFKKIEAQLYRKLAHDFFTVAVSKFHENKPYNEIVKDISEHLAMEPYAKAVAACEFRDTKRGDLMIFALRGRVWVLLFLFAKFKELKRRVNK